MTADPGTQPPGFYTDDGDDLADREPCGGCGHYAFFHWANPNGGGCNDGNCSCDGFETKD